MELYPKPVDFDDSWDRLRDCTQRLMMGDVYMNNNYWNDRISYPFSSRLFAVYRDENLVINSVIFRPNPSHNYLSFTHTHRCQNSDGKIEGKKISQHNPNKA